MVGFLVVAVNVSTFAVEDLSVVDVVVVVVIVVVEVVVVVVPSLTNLG